jgi:hypothetical protein
MQPTCALRLFVLGILHKNLIKGHDLEFLNQPNAVAACTKLEAAAPILQCGSSQRSSCWKEAGEQCREERCGTQESVSKILRENLNVAHKLSIRDGCLVTRLTILEHHLKEKRSLPLLTLQVPIEPPHY